MERKVAVSEYKQVLFYGDAAFELNFDLQIFWIYLYGR